jgi:hypothetical protein
MDFKIKSAHTNMILNGDNIYISSGPVNSSNFYKYSTNGILMKEKTFDEPKEKAIQGDGFIQDENNNLYHFGKYSLRAKKLDNNFNVILERILTEKSRSDDLEINKKNYIECAYYFKKYLFVIYFERTPKVGRTILVYDTDLNYIGEINSLIPGTFVAQNCGNYFITFYLPSNSKQKELQNFKLNFYEFSGF